MNLELRGSSESNFILRYNSASNGLTPNRKFVFILEDFFISVLRLRPIEKIRSRMHKILNATIQFPILNVKSIEHTLIRGSKIYELDNLFLSEYQQPMHFIIGLQRESVWSGDLHKSEVNPYNFTTCDLDQFSFRHGDYKYPSTGFSSSG